MTTGQWVQITFGHAVNLNGNPFHVKENYDRLFSEIEIEKNALARSVPECQPLLPAVFSVRLRPFPALLRLWPASLRIFCCVAIIAVTSNSATLILYCWKYYICLLFLHWSLPKHSNPSPSQTSPSPHYCLCPLVMLLSVHTSQILQYFKELRRCSGL